MIQAARISSFSEKFIAFLACIFLFATLRFGFRLFTPAGLIYLPLLLSLISVASFYFIYVVKYGKTPNKCLGFFYFIGSLLAFILIPLFVPVFPPLCQYVSACFIVLPLFTECFPLFIKHIIELSVGVKHIIELPVGVKIPMSGSFSMDRPDRVKTPEIKITHGIRYNKTLNCSVDWHKLNTNQITPKEFLEETFAKCTRIIRYNTDKLEKLYLAHSKNSCFENVAKIRSERIALQAKLQIKESIIHDMKIMNNKSKHSVISQAERASRILKNTKDV